MDGAIRISGYKGEDAVVEIPAMIDEKPVRFIHDKAFIDCKQITEVRVPDTVVSIGKSAFSGCTNLEKIQIPASVTAIGSSAFSCCSSLENITIPGSVSVLGWYVFSDPA